MIKTFNRQEFIKYSFYTIIEEQANGKRKALCMGMVYSKEYRFNVMGQMGRDRVRCEGMEADGWDVYTIDNKHPEIMTRLDRVKGRLVESQDHLAKHCNSDFCGRLFFRDLRTRFGASVFKVIILDYFFSPSGYVDIRWTARLFDTTLPKFASEGWLEVGGSIWLPHSKYVATTVEHYRHSLQQYFVIEYVKDPLRNPLYAATDRKDVFDNLSRFPEILVNSNQISPYLWHSHDHHNHPFILLTSHRGTSTADDEEDPPKKGNSDPTKSAAPRREKGTFASCDVSNHANELLNKKRPLSTKQRRVVDKYKDRHIDDDGDDDVYEVVMVDGEEFLFPL